MPTKTGILVIRHGREAWKVTNTARMAPHLLPSCTLVDYGMPGPAFDEPRLREPRTWLLFPEGEPPAEGEELPEQLVVLDGSWQQARRMMQRIPELRGMPRLSLAKPVLERRAMRKQVLEDGMSTLEAIAAAVAFLEGEEKGEALFRFNDLWVKRALSLREKVEE